MEYDGTNYAGWQRQENAMSVQEALENEIFAVTGEKATVSGAGRTDSGVHALGQVAHFDTNARMGGEKFAFALNAGLPKDIRVKASREVSGDFHARFSAKSKRYRYTMRVSAHASALYSRFELHRHEWPDVERMWRAAEALLGTHDFASFMAAGSRVKDTVRTLSRCEWTQSGENLFFDVEGNGFLYHMVRIMVGTMLEIGQGKGDMRRILEGRDRALAGPTAPAHGLMLMDVLYDGIY